MDAKPHGEDIDYDSVYKSDDPIKGWIPKHEKDLRKLYPNVDYPDEPGEHHWITIFESWGFIRVDNIQVID